MNPFAVPREWVHQNFAGFGRPRFPMQGQQLARGAFQPQGHQDSWRQPRQHRPAFSEASRYPEVGFSEVGSSVATQVSSLQATLLVTAKSELRLPVRAVGTKYCLKRWREITSDPFVLQELDWILSASLPSR